MRIMNLRGVKSQRRDLRSNQTFTEKRLWQALRRRNIEGVLFRRQFSVEHFILDFYAPEITLAIEVDGISHASEEARQYDAWRQELVERHGISFLRITDRDVMDRFERVVEQVAERVREEKKKAGERELADSDASETPP